MMRFPIFSIACLVQYAVAANPTVNITNGTVVGSTVNGVDSFMGIPFATPPLGPLRLKPPQPLNKSFGVLNSTKTPLSCPQFSFQLNITDLSLDTATAFLKYLSSAEFQRASNSAEDCLTLNIQRPSFANATSKLPVVFWIFGGAFVGGAASTYDFSSWLWRSIQFGQPVIFVAANYRTGGFGFLAGKDLAEEGSTNLGLRDQRIALEWVADNIEAFGGDPDKVTLWGGSAGAISVCDQTLIKNGDHTYKGKPLFRGAIMNSGSIVPANNVSTPYAQSIYDLVLANTGCNASTGSSRLACLRGLEYGKFLAAANSPPAILGPSPLHLSYMPRPDNGDSFFPQSPEIQLAEGKFAKVPVIIGDMLDEGTVFALGANITNNDMLIQYLSNYFPDNPNAVTSTAKLASFYPDQPDAGSPYNTGDNFALYPEYKRLASIAGDLVFILARRIYLDLLTAQGVDAWSYLGTFLSGPFGMPYLGTFHGADSLIFLPTTSQYVHLQNAFQQHYFSFFTHLDPNRVVKSPDNTADQVLNWPGYNSSTKQLLTIGISDTSITNDDFRDDAARYIAANARDFRA